MADDTINRNVVTKISVEAPPNIDRPFRQMADAADKAHQSTRRFTDGFATNIRKLDRGMMSLSMGFMGLNTSLVAMNSSFVQGIGHMGRFSAGVGQMGSHMGQAGRHMQTFAQHAQSVMVTLGAIHSGFMILRGGALVFSVLGGAVETYAIKALAAARANMALAASHQAVAQAAGQQSLMQRVAAVGGGFGRGSLIAGGVGGLAGGVAGYYAGGAVGHEGWGSAIGSIAGTALAARYGPGMIGGIGRMLGMGAATAAAPAGGSMIAGMSASGTAAGGLFTGDGAAAGGGTAAAAGGGIGSTAGFLASRILPPLAIYEGIMWGQNRLGKWTGLWDNTEFTQKATVSGNLRALIDAGGDWYSESYGAGAKKITRLEEARHQRAMMLRNAMMEHQQGAGLRKLRFQERDRLAHEADLGAMEDIQVRRLRFDTQGAARGLQRGFQGRFGQAIGLMGRESALNNPEEQYFQDSLRVQAERMAEHMGQAQERARERTQDAREREKVFTGRAQQFGAEASAATRRRVQAEEALNLKGRLGTATAEDQTQVLKLLEEENHARQRQADAINKARQAHGQYVQSLQHEKDVTAENEAQFKHFAEEQERHYREIRQQQERKIKGLKMDFAFMDPTEIDRMTQMAQRFKGLIEHPQQGKPARIAMLGGRARFIPGTVGGFTHEEMGYIKSNPFFDLLREKYADKVAENNPALQELLKTTGQTEKLEAAKRQEKLFADIKVNLQQKLDMELRINSGDVAEQLKNRLQQPIQQMIQGISAELERKIHIGDVLRRDQMAAMAQQGS